MKKQFIAKLLVLTMVLSMVPVTILAASANTAEAGSNGGYYDVYVDTTVRVDVPVSEDGSIDVTVTNGAATVMLDAKAAESLTDLAKDGKIELTLNDEGASRLNFAIPAKALTAVAEETGADLVLNSSVATISIPNEVLANELGTSGTVKISAQADETSVSFSIQVSGRALKGVKGIQVTF